MSNGVTGNGSAVLFVPKRAAVKGFGLSRAQRRLAYVRRSAWKVMRIWDDRHTSTLMPARGAAGIEMAGSSERF
jgi:hypothetical protein